MCLIYYRDNSKHTAPPNVDALLRAHTNNPDGFGMLVWNNGRWKHRKHESITAEHLKSLIAKLSKTSEKWAFHFRYATHGEVCKANAHPFWIKSNVYLMHNGILPAPWSSDRNKSDTLCLVEMMRRCLSGQAVVDDFLSLLENATSGNRLLITHGTGAHLTGTWAEKDDGSYSNSSCHTPACNSYRGQSRMTYDSDWNYGDWSNQRRWDTRPAIGYGSNSTNTRSTLDSDDAETWVEIRSPETGVSRWQSYRAGREKTVYTRPTTGKVIDATLPAAKPVVDGTIKSQAVETDNTQFQDLQRLLPLSSQLCDQLIQADEILKAMPNTERDTISIPLYAGIDTDELCDVKVSRKSAKRLAARGYLLGVQYASWRIKHRLGMDSLYRTFKLVAANGALHSIATKKQLWENPSYTPDALDSWCWGFHEGHCALFMSFYTSKEPSVAKFVPEKIGLTKRELFRIGLAAMIGDSLPYALDDVRTLSDSVKQYSKEQVAELVIKVGLEFTNATNEAAALTNEAAD